MSHTRRLQLAYVCYYGVGAEDLIMKLFTVRDTMPADADRGGALPRWDLLVIETSLPHRRSSFTTSLIVSLSGCVWMWFET